MNSLYINEPNISNAFEVEPITADRTHYQESNLEPSIIWRHDKNYYVIGGTIKYVALILWDLNIKAKVWMKITNKNNQHSYIFEEFKLFAKYIC